MTPWGESSHAAFLPCDTYPVLLTVPVISVARRTEIFFIYVCRSQKRTQCIHETGSRAAMFQDWLATTSSGEARVSRGGHEAVPFLSGAVGS